MVCQEDLVTGNCQSFRDGEEIPANKENQEMKRHGIDLVIP